MTNPTVSDRTLLTDTEPPTRTLGSRLAGVAAYVGELPRGDRAELRRVSVSRTPPAPFWKIVGRYAIRPNEEDFFIGVIPAMVLCPHKPGRSPGRVLRAAKVSAARVERWLRMNRATALRECQRILAQARDGVDWAELGTLLYLWERPQGNALRRKLARSYYVGDPASAADDDSETTNGEDE